MPDITFDWHQVKRLTNALGRFSTELDREEWALLLAIFAAAADKIDPSPDGKSGTLPAAQIRGNGETVEDPRESDAVELREQLLDAYTPGKSPPQGFSDNVHP
jgi:hypothetical protein